MVECIVLSLGLVHNAEIALSAALRMMCHHVSFCGPGGACSTGLGDFALGASSGTDLLAIGPCPCSIKPNRATCPTCIIINFFHGGKGIRVNISC